MPAAKKTADPIDPEVAKREQMAAEHPDTWIWIRPGDSITGTMIDLDIAWSDLKNAEYYIITLDTQERGEVKIHCMAASLYGEVDRKRPKPGERMTFSYHGQGEAKRRGQSGAHIFRLRIEGRDASAVNDMYDRVSRVNRGQAAPPPANGRQEVPPGPPVDDPDGADHPF